MRRFFIQRFLSGIAVILGVTALTFFMVRLAPGDPFTSQNDRVLPAETLSELQRLYHLDDPLPMQFVRYVGRLAQGEFGPSFKHKGKSVGEIIASGFPVSLMIGFGGLFFALLLGIPAGVVSALNHGKFADHAHRFVFMVGICLPTFVLGPLLALVLGQWMGIVPVSGWFGWRNVFLPSLTLGLVYAAYVARILRGGMLEVMKEDYILHARAKGLSPARVVFRHILPLGSLPVINFLGPAIAGMISGSFVVENIFQVPGLGQHFVRAAVDRDYWLACGTTVVYAALVVVCNFGVDLLQFRLNPAGRRED